MTREAVLATCGLPDGIRWIPKLVGRWYLIELCSAPAYVYGTNAVAVGCDREVAFVQNLAVDDDGMLEPGPASLLDDVRARVERVPSIAQWQHESMTVEERELVVEALGTLQTDADPLVRRSVQRTLAALEAKSEKAPDLLTSCGIG